MRIPRRELIKPDPGPEPFLQRPIHEDMEWLYDYMRALFRGRYAHISNVLTDEALELLDELPVPVNGKCPAEALGTHLVAAPLVRTMAKISLMNGYNDPDPDKVRASLRNQSGTNLELPMHRDFLDGHAVLFNWNVQGDLYYRIDNSSVKLDSNEIVILNGSADSISVSGLVSSTDPLADTVELGFASPLHGVQGHGFTSRNRLLVFADGIETTVTQIAA